MSLRAGYKGIKSSIAAGISGVVVKFSDALAIKSIGSGLSLSQAGALSADVKSIGSGLALSETGTLSEYHTFSSTEKLIGKLGNDDLYEKTFVFTTDDFEDNDTKVVSDSAIKGQFVLDIGDPKQFWIDYGNSFMWNDHDTPAPASMALNFYSGGDGSQFTRCNCQRRQSVLDGAPFIYFENTYAPTIYSNISDVSWIFTIRYTKNPVSPASNTRKKK